MYQWKLSSCLVLVIISLIFFGNFASAQEKISVIVIKDDSSNKLKSFSLSSSSVQISNWEITHQYSSVSGFSADVTLEEYEKLKLDSSLKVFEDRKVYASLDKSAPQIGANNSWALNINNTNLTGIGQTVCIIDTGVNYSHSAFGNCYGNNNASSNCTIIGGYDFVNNDADPMDDYGHGTHVAGIVASSNSLYKGISPGAKIIAIKALDSTGSGFSVNVLAGIDWCINNASKFNISVISMSLGDNSTHNSYCNGDSFASYINKAVSKNISVVVAAGNCDQPGQRNCTIGVSSPACVQNATAVGAVNKTDSIFYMRGALFELLAPGVSITSSILNGGYGQLSGTSMSTPHVAAAIAILQQMSSLQNNRSLSGMEIKNVLNNTGLRIDDVNNSGYNFTRINIYNALLSLDKINPLVNLNYPLNNTLNFSQNQTLNFNATDWQLKNATLYIWNSTGIYNTSYVNLTGTQNSSLFYLINIPYGNYKWNVLVSDLNNNSAFAGANFSLIIGGVDSGVIGPENNTYTNVNSTNFSCSARSASNYNLTNITFYLFNSSTITFNLTKNLTGFEGNQTFNYTFSQETNYSWYCLAKNNNSQNSSTQNYSITYDITVPLISNLVISAGLSSATIDWNTNEETNSKISYGLAQNNSLFTQNHSELISGISASTSYEYTLTFCDRAGNCNSTNGSFTTSAEPVTQHSGGGGGGGGGVVPPISLSQLLQGYNKNFYVGERINFRLNNETHSIQLNKIINNSVNITVKSEPINLILSVGEERKTNLSSLEYYDLQIKLENISQNKANMTLKAIYEPIVIENRFRIQNNPNETVENSETILEQKQDFSWFVAVIVGFIIIVAALIERKLNQKRLKTKSTLKRYEKTKA